MRSFLAFPIAVLLSGLAVAPSFAQTCPQNTFEEGANNYYVFDSSHDAIHSWGGANHYNLIAGTLNGAGGGGGGEVGSFTGLSIRDTYRIVGPATVTPIAFTVRFAADGSAGAAMSFMPGFGDVCRTAGATFRILSGAATDEVAVAGSFSPCQATTIDHDVELALAHLPGVDFDVAVGATMHGAGYASASFAGLLSFEGLPPGYTIQSCQGFAGPVVPVAHRSWGSLKHGYR